MPKNSKPAPSDLEIVRRESEQQIPSHWLPDLDVLRRVIERSGTVNRPVKRHYAESGALSDIRVATITLDLQLEDFVPVNKGDYTLYVVKDNARRKRLQERFLASIRQAAKAGAKLICFNELAYPKPLDDEEEQRFTRQIIQLVEKHRLFLIAGGYHDETDGYNLCPVFSCDSIRGESQKMLPHAKLTSALSLHEIIRLPSNRNIRYYETEYGVFSILICLDVYDPTLIFRLIRMNHPNNDDGKLDIIFVPSFSTEKSPSLAQACRDLSYTTASLVVYANGARNEPRHAAYLAGQPVEINSVRKNNSPIETYRGCKLSKDIVLYEVNYQEYLRLRRERTNSYSKVFDYLVSKRGSLQHDINLGT